MSGTSTGVNPTPFCYDEQSYDVFCKEDASDSHYSSTRVNAITTTANPNLYWQEPIVVGYAFGPKKMSTMGVVMAEASRVKVIHEELDEGKYDDEDIVAEEEYDEALFCEDGVTIGKNAIKNGMMIDSLPEQSDHQRKPSLLTRAALRGLEQETIKTKNRTSTEVIDTNNNIISSNRKINSIITYGALSSNIDHCPGPESTIITLGNTNDSDLQHIVRYFRSSCSSAAASTSIASVSETTVSTPTTTNSYSTVSNSNRHQHQQQQPRCRGQRNRFPVQISFVPIDPDQPIEEQHGGHFDLILHKLTEDILACSLMQDTLEKSQQQQQLQSQSQKIQDPSRRRIHALRDYCFNRNRNCCLVDDPKHVQMVMSRSEIANVLEYCLKDVKTASGIPVKSPRFVVIPERQQVQSSEKTVKSQENQTKELKQALQGNNQGGIMLSTPLIVKPLIAAGTKQSHCMSIALQESALAKLPSKSIVQEFVNHNATLYKVYVLGDFVNVYERHSLPNLPADLSNATVDLVEFDSQRPYPRLKDFGLDVKTNSFCSSSTRSGNHTDSCNNDVTSTTTSRHSIYTSALPDLFSTSVYPQVHVPVTVTVNEVKPIVDVLKEAFGLQLFGFDILMGSNNGECFVVDVNYFPSYKEVPNFPSLLAQYLTQRVLEQRRKGRMPNNNTGNYNNSANTTAADDDVATAMAPENDYNGRNSSEDNTIVPPNNI